MELRVLKTDEELEGVLNVLKELRPHLTVSNYLVLYHTAQRQDAFTIIGAFENGECVGVMGYRILHDFVHGKSLYVDDLVVAEKQRSKGIGKKLLKYAERVAQELGCQYLRLCSGLQREEAHRFYERCGCEKKSYSFNKKLG